MDEFKPEDELKPDTSDRRPQRQQRSHRLSTPRLALSRQHLMIGIGILVLVLLIIAVGSALQSPSKPASSAGVQNAPTAGSGEKNIDLSAPSSVTPTAPAGESTSAPGQPQTLNAPSISNTPTVAPITPAPVGQQRIELPGNMTDALSTQQDKVNAVSQGAMGQGVASQGAASQGAAGQGVTSGNNPVTTLPTAPAALAPAGKLPARATDTLSHDKALHDKTVQEKQTHGKSALTSTPKVPMTSDKPMASGNKSTVSGQVGAIQNAPASHFTLQLSSASRSDTLKAYAKQHNLPNAWVYETKRDGKPWYVLVNGIYASSAEAKQAVSSLPADVQAQKPWVKPIRQVKQDLNK